MICKSYNPRDVASAFLEANGSILAVPGSAPEFRAVFPKLKSYPRDQQCGEDHEIGDRIISYLRQLGHLGPVWSCRMSDDSALGCDVLFSMDPLTFNKKKEANNLLEDEIVIVTMFSVSETERMISEWILTGLVRLGDQLRFMPSNNSQIVGYGRQLQFSETNDDMCLYFSKNMNNQDIEIVCSTVHSVYPEYVFPATDILSINGKMPEFAESKKIKVGDKAEVVIEVIYGKIFLPRLKDCPKVAEFILEYGPNQLIARGKVEYVVA